MTDERDNLPHPMQPIGFDGHSTDVNDRGCIRFKENKIVSLLLHNGKFDLNALAMMVSKGMASQEDYTQLMQLIGYSVSGYGDLSTSPPALVAQADSMADNLSARDEIIKQLEARYGMEDLDSHIHELKAQEASDINNSSFEEQVDYLIERAGVDWIRDALLEGRDD